MKTSNTKLIEELKQAKSVVTRNSIEHILLGRNNRGDKEAGELLYQWLKWWIK